MQRPQILIRRGPAPVQRFRYETEGRNAGRIVTEGEGRRDPVEIELINYSGAFTLYVSLVSEHELFAHPNHLVGRDCQDGVFVREYPAGNTSNRTITFDNLGIHCVKNNQITDSLQERHRMNVDPFQKGFEHISNHSRVDKKRVRLAFVAVLRGKDGRPIDRIVERSEVMKDKKSMMPDPVIKLVSISSALAKGGETLIIPCEQTDINDVRVRFFENSSTLRTCIWEDFGRELYLPNKYCIVVKVPPYRNPRITEPVDVLLQIEFPIQGVASSPTEFKYHPAPNDNLENGTHTPNTLPSMFPTREPLSPPNLNQAVTPIAGPSNVQTPQYSVTQTMKVYLSETLFPLISEEETAPQAPQAVPVELPVESTIEAVGGPVFYYLNGNQNGFIMTAAPAHPNNLNIPYEPQAGTSSAPRTQNGQTHSAESGSSEQNTDDESNMVPPLPNLVIECLSDEIKKMDISFL